MGDRDVRSPRGVVVVGQAFFLFPLTWKKEKKKARLLLQGGRRGCSSRKLRPHAAHTHTRNQRSTTTQTHNHSAAGPRMVVVVVVVVGGRSQGIDKGSPLGVALRSISLNQKAQSADSPARPAGPPRLSGPATIETAAGLALASIVSICQSFGLSSKARRRRCCCF
jgi:hypothetical protein